MATVDFSSGVYLFEKNLSTRPRGQSNDTVGLIGRFKKGRVNQRTLITSPREKLQRFGSNDLMLGRFGNVADDILTESARLYMVRVATGCKYAGLVCRKDSTAQVPSPVITTTPGTGASLGGTLTNGNYSYKVGAFDLYGETVASANVVATVITSATRASLTTTFGEANSNLVYSAVTLGVVGNSNKITYLDPNGVTPGSAPSQNLAITIVQGVGYAEVEISLATNALGAIVTTANDILVALITQGTAFSNYMTVTLASGSNGSAVVGSLAETALAGGASTGANDGYIDINWNNLAARGAIGYRVYGRTGGDWNLISEVEGGSVTTFRDTGVATPDAAKPAKTVNTTSDLALLPWVLGEDDPENVYTFQSSDLFIIYADNQGVWGNTDIRIAISRVNTNNQTFELTIYDGRGAPVDKMWVARERKLDGYGQQLFIEDRVNPFSDLIKIRNNPLNSNQVTTLFPYPTFMAGGDDGTVPTDGDFIQAAQLFADPDQVRVRQLVNAGYTSLPFQQALIGIAEARKDCVARLDSPPTAQTSVSAALQWRNIEANYATSFATMMCSDKIAYDAENAAQIFVPMSGEEAAAFIRVSRREAPWFAAAGQQNGRLTNNFLGTRRQNSGATMPSNQSERNALAEAHINYVVTKPGRGSWIGEQFTLTAEPSLLENANVRFLIINVQQAIAEFLDYMVFQPNDTIVRRQITLNVTSYLERVRGQRGIRDNFEVICNDSNNSGADQDEGIINLEVAMTPVTPGRRIAFTTIIKPSGYSYSFYNANV
jgi:hypothetical protein